MLGQTIVDGRRDIDERCWYGLASDIFMAIWVYIPSRSCNTKVVRHDRMSEGEKLITTAEAKVTLLLVRLLKIFAVHYQDVAL
jgi:hypothetical protein